MNELERNLKQFELTRRYRRTPFRRRYKLYWSNHPVKQSWEPGAVACIRSGSDRRFFYSLEELETYIEQIEEKGLSYVD